MHSYVAGINAYYRKNGHGLRPWTTTDVIAVGSLLGANLGVGGGDETRRSLFLDALRQPLRRSLTLRHWRPARRAGRPADTGERRRLFPYDQRGAGGRGTSCSTTAASSRAAATSPSHSTSRARSPRATRCSSRPAARRRSTRSSSPGPQVGYAYPELLLELDLHGGGIDARGAAFPGLSFYIELGRGKDFAWSATSANSDIVDHYVETLCGGDDVHYLYNGTCRR